MRFGAILLRNTRKTVTVSSTPPKGLVSSFAIWRRASAPFALLIGFSLSLTASSAAEEDDLLARARAVNRNAYADLQSFICHQEMSRFRGSLTGDRVRQIDTVTASVAFQNGAENYSEVRQNNHVRTDLSSLGGAWSEGEFGTLLRQTETLLETQAVRFIRFDSAKGSSAALFTFDVSADDSPWELDIESQQYHVPFRTEAWVSPTTGRIVKIVRTSTQLAPELHISELKWTVDLEPVELNGTSWLLPKTAQYEVRYSESRRREWNVIEFSDYHRYSVDSALLFGPVN